MYITVMTWHYREDRATQAAARFLKQRGGKMSVLKLMKLMYLADRKALLELGRPITFDHYLSMPKGPVLSRTLDLINLERAPGEEPTYWAKHISPRVGYDVELLGGAPNDQLSEAEEAILDSVFDEFGKMNRFKLADRTHELPEWQDPHGSAIPITVRDILIAEGWTAEEADDVESALCAENLLDQLTA